MSDARKYTVAEIDRMRRAISQRENLSMQGQSFYPNERHAKIEDMLRTYMANGTEPEELERAASQEAAEMQQFRLNAQNQKLPLR